MKTKQVKVYSMGKVDKALTKKFNHKPKQSLKDIISRRARTARDARLVKFF